MSHGSRQNRLHGRENMAEPVVQCRMTRNSHTMQIQKENLVLETEADCNCLEAP